MNNRFYGNRPHIKVSINNLIIPALIDTGTEFSVISGEIVQQLNILIDNSTKVQFTTCVDGITQSTGLVELWFTFNSERHRIIASVAQNSINKLILGMDFIKGLKITIEGANNIITYYNKTSNSKTVIDSFQPIIAMEARHHFEHHINHDIQAIDIIHNTGIASQVIQFNTDLDVNAINTESTLLENIIDDLFYTTEDIESNNRNTVINEVEVNAINYEFPNTYNYKTFMEQFSEDFSRLDGKRRREAQTVLWANKEGFSIHEYDIGTYVPFGNSNSPKEV